MKKSACALVLLLFLSFALFSLPQIGVVKAESTIYIRADGSVEGTDKISQMGNVYTFLKKINGSIIVEKDDVVVDGSGYVLQPETATDNIGIDLRDRNNVTVRNLRIRSFGRGILLLNSNNCHIYQNNITDNSHGIKMVDHSSRNRIIENHLENNGMGLQLSSVNPGSDNTISGNLITNNTNGMVVKDFPNTSILDNKLEKNEYALVVGLGPGSILRNNTMTDNIYGFKAYNVQGIEVDTSNTVNGKPIYYWVNQQGKTIPEDAGYVALIGCTNITVKNLYLTGNLEGILLGSTTNSIIINNKFSGNLFGIRLAGSDNNTIKDNLVTDNQNGIGLTSSSSKNIICGNEITAKRVVSDEGKLSSGIYMNDASGNTIMQNNITDSEIGVYTTYCETNMIHHNNFIDNTKNWHDEGISPYWWGPPVSVSIWDDGKEGNYWSDYNGTDGDNDGIGDLPYSFVINSHFTVDNIINHDNFPLMKPVDIEVIPEFPSWTPLLFTFIALVIVLAVYRRKLRKAYSVKELTRKNSLGRAQRNS